MANLSIGKELFGIDNLLVSEDFDEVIQRMERLKTNNPDYSKFSEGYLVDYYLAQALHRRSLKNNNSLIELEKAISLYSESLKLKGDFVDNHFLLSRANMLRCELVDGKEREKSRKNAIFHSVVAKRLNPDLTEECNRDLSSLLELGVSICSTRPRANDPYKREFRDYPEVNIVLRDSLSPNSDAVVSSANSFGFMDGGFDYKLSEYFGWDLEKRLQEKIKREYCGELLVGQAVVIETGNQRIPYLISAPTMRVPRALSNDSVNAYLATRAALSVIENFNKEKKKISHVSFPLLCTGIGEMPTTTSARQMRTAYDEVILGQYSFPEEIGEAQEREAILFSDYISEYFNRIKKRKYHPEQD